MKARGRRPSAFIVSRCLETPVKHDARVFDMASQSAPNCKQKKTRKQKNKRMQKSHRRVIFAFFCLISPQFVMMMSVFFATEACFFQIVTICIEWHPASSETWTVWLRMNLAGFDHPKVCKKKILCLYSPTVKVHSTKTNGPLRF